MSTVFSPLVEKTLEEIDCDGPQGTMLRIADSMPTMMGKGSRASQAKVASERVVNVDYCSSKDTFYHGAGLHVVAEQKSGQLPLLMRARLTPGSENDLRTLRSVLPEIESGVLCGDKAYCDEPLKEQLAETQDLGLHSDQRRRSRRPISSIRRP